MLLRIKCDCGHSTWRWQIGNCLIATVDGKNELWCPKCHNLVKATPSFISISRVPKEKIDVS